MPEVARLGMYEDELYHASYFSVSLLISEAFKRCGTSPMAEAILTPSIFVAIGYVAFASCELELNEIDRVVSQ